MVDHLALAVRDRFSSSTRRLRFVPAVVAASALVLGAAACGGSDSDSDTARTASSADCPARFGCAKTAAEFQVVNNTDTELRLEARTIGNVSNANRPSLTLTVPARSSSAKQAVFLGDDGFQPESGYVPGWTEGEWIWTIRSGSSTTEARVELAFSDDFSTGLQFVQARSLIGQPPTIL